MIKNWGMIPAEISGTEEAREAHFRRTIEPYTPRLPLPPFNGEEAQSFVQRLAQLAARDTSIAARPALGRAASGEQTRAPTPPVQPSPVARSLARPWLAPFIATVIAGSCLAAIELLHLLVYPLPGLGALARADLETQKAVNEALEERLRQLQAVSGKVCQNVPGVATPPDGADFRTLLPAPRRRARRRPRPRRKSRSRRRRPWRTS